MEQIFPDREKIISSSISSINTYTQEYSINIFYPSEDHIKKTWHAYFNGGAPFKGEKKNDDSSQNRRKDIPDAWIYQAALDVKDKYGRNSDCVLVYNGTSKEGAQGKDGNLHNSLNQIGYRSLDIDTLLKELETTTAKNPDASTSETCRAHVLTQEALHNVSDMPITPDNLEAILATARTPQQREIYLRLMGYAHWLQGPGKQDIYDVLSRRGYDTELINASIVLLSRDPLQPIKDIGKYVLPFDKVTCSKAADAIMPEILELLDQV